MFNNDAPTSPSHADRLAAARRSRTLDTFAVALESAHELPVPAPVTEVVARDRGVLPLLPAEAFELARQVYYLQHGSLTDAARAVVAAGLSDVDSVTQVRDRLANWWERENWPKRAPSATFALRDANYDGGLFRGARTCCSLTTGKGVAPAGAPCGQTALADSEYCFHHDPRPEYVAARKEHAQRLLESRLANLVPLQPFASWCDTTRAELVAEARRRGFPVHSSDTGWASLASYLKVDKSKLHRLARKGINSDGSTDATVRASTVVRYLEALEDVSFEDLYGFPPPARHARSDAAALCPGCGGAKNPSSDSCRSCFIASASQCAYRNRRGEQCPSKTRDASGYCYHCRRLVERVPRPGTGRASFLTDGMLTLATGAFAETPTFAVIGRRMWAANAEGVCDVFRSCQTLTGGLVKLFAKRGWSTPAAIAAAHEDLVRRHGDVAWPAEAPVALECSRTLPAGPFVIWLQARYAEVGTYEALAERIPLNPATISKHLRRAEGASVFRATVAASVASWDDGTTLGDLYPELGVTR